MRMRVAMRTVDRDRVVGLSPAVPAKAEGSGALTEERTRRIAPLAQGELIA